MEGEGRDRGRGRGDAGIAALLYIQLLRASQRDQLNRVRYNRQLLMYYRTWLPMLIILAFVALIVLRTYQKWF